MKIYNSMLVTVIVAGMLLLTAGVASGFNTPPVANAGEDQTVYLGANVYLLGTATDDDGDPIVTWESTWKTRPGGSTAELDAPLKPNPVFTPDVAGDYEVSLVVSDGIARSLSDSVVIHVIENQLRVDEIFEPYQPFEFYKAGPLRK